MKNEEFRARQMWLKFTDAVGIALEVIGEGIESLREWFKKWNKKTPSPRTENYTYPLPFVYLEPEKA